MPSITFDGRIYVPDAGETVLDALLRNGVPVAHSCKAGVCQSCVMRCTGGGKPPEAAQKGLKETLRAQGYFLACACKPEADLAVAMAADVMTTAPAVVERVERLTRDVARVWLAPRGAFDYRAGQFVNLARPADGLVRSYSIASLPQRDALLELHVRKVPGGRMSAWLYDEARGGETVELRGPAGDCFYVPGRPEQPMLLVGTGTGLAPLYGIVQDALRQGHTGPITLYHGALDALGLYLVDEMRALSERHPNFTYVRCLMTGDAGPGVRIGSIDQVVLGEIKKFAGWRVFLCGNPALVAALKKKVFLAGAKMSDIHADPFVSAAVK